MAKGGARTRSGPAPDPDALRRERDAGEWTILPAEGREGATPDWPITEQSDREAELWERLWTMPQALMWERYGQDIEVALYVRRLCEAEKPDAFIGLGTLIRQMGDSLGLSTPGMRANRWRIDRPSKEDETLTVVPSEAPNATVYDARARLRAASGGSG